MSTLLDNLMQQLGGDTIQQIGRQLGTDPATTSTAVSAALPALLSALARNAQTPTGAGALASALDKDHDGSVLNDLPGLLGSGGGAGASILGHIFGAKQDVVSNGVSATAGLGKDQSTQLLAMLAPIVMGVLGSAKRSRGLDAGGLASMLGQERSRIGTPTGGLGSLMQLIDQDGDGSIIDDVGGMLGKMLGR